LSRLPSAAPLRASSLPDALPILVRGRAPAGGELPGPAAGPELTGPAVLSSLRSVADGGADRLEARLVSMSAAEQDVRLTAPGARSEEHTYELQSRFDIVCRRLLE